MKSSAATQADREQLRRIIVQWNENRLDLFNLSEPNEKLEFHGVMRFYFQDCGQKAATKCIRVCSTATTRAVTEALVEKFHPDLKMLTTPSYSLWEVHESGEERRLAADEKPLLVQLNWHKDDREGRFVLKRQGQHYLPIRRSEAADEEPTNTAMGRKLSRREKKEAKRRRQQQEDEERKRRRRLGGSVDQLQHAVAAPVQFGSRRSYDVDEDARSIYDEVPSHPFTRTISNPEIVMKKRREIRLERKLKEMGEREGGSLKIYGTELNREKPYITLLVSSKDKAVRLVKETLDKYGLDLHDPADYCLVQLMYSKDGGSGVGLPISERVLDDFESPVMFLTDEGNFEFHIRRRRSGERMSRPVSAVILPHRHSSGSGSAGTDLPRSPSSSPCLLQLRQDGSADVAVHPIQPNVTEIGNDMRALSSNYMLLSGPYVLPKHCVLAFMDGVVTLTPCSSGAEIEIDGRAVHETTILHDGGLIRLGRTNEFRFFETTPNLSKDLPAPPDINNSTAVRSVPAQMFAKSTSSEVTNIMSDDCGIPLSTLADPSTFDVTPELLNSLMFSRLTKPENRLQNLKKTVDQKATVGQPKSEGNDFASVRTVEKESTFGTEPASVTERLIVGGQKFENRKSEPRTSGIAAQRSFSGRDAVPAVVELHDGACDVSEEDMFLTKLIRDTKVDDIQFKLAPAYMIYMSCRYRISPHYKPTLSPQQRSAQLSDFLTKITNYISLIIQDNCHDSSALALLLANASELLNFMKRDRNLAAATSAEPQNTLRETVEKAFDHLTSACRHQLGGAMPAALDRRLDSPAAIGPCLHMLTDTMGLLRQCRFNAALTIQLFSHLFHYVNMYLFNWLVSKEGADYCCRSWAGELAGRLDAVHRWAHEQGLEMAADCHLDRITQAVRLLDTPKTLDNLANLGSTCYTLNSIQVRRLLERYWAEEGEEAPSAQLIRHVVEVAESQADETARAEGVEVRVEESVDLDLPFILPEDNYSVELIHGVPPALTVLTNAFTYAGLCRMITQPSSSGSWMVHFISLSQAEDNAAPSAERFNTAAAVLFGSAQGVGPPSPAPVEPRERTEPTGPAIETVALNRGGGGIGLSIVAAQPAPGENIGIYVKKVVPGSIADKDGRLQAGDQLLKVNGHNLIGLTQEEAARLMASSGPVVSFEVAKQAAVYNGLANWLQQPTAQSDAPQPPFHSHSASNTSLPTVQQQQQRQLFRNAGGVNRQERFGSATQIGSSSRLETSSSQGFVVGPPAKLPSRFRPSALAPVERSISGPQLDRPVVQTDYQNVHFVENQVQPTASKSGFLQPVVVDTLPSEQRKNLNWENYQNVELGSPLRRSSDSPSSRLVASPSAVQKIQSPSIPSPSLRFEREEHKQKMDDFVNSEITRLMKEEMSRLDSKKKLNEEEARRYNALLYELAYKQRLKESSTPTEQAPTAPTAVSPFSPADDKANPGPTQVNNMRTAADEVEARLAVVTVTKEPTVAPTYHEVVELEKSASLGRNGRIATPPTGEKFGSPAPLQDDNQNEIIRYEEEEEESKRYIYADPTNEAPRVQILGAQEVYRDPRQARLHQLNTSKTTPMVDGANLNFKDKMRLFAQQIGENTPKSRQTVSSAQKEIETSAVVTMQSPSRPY